MMKRIPYDQQLPPWYGVAWRELRENVAVCFPVPLNVIVYFLRSIYIYLQVGGREVYTSPRDAYLQGISEGQLIVESNLYEKAIAENFKMRPDVEPYLDPYHPSNGDRYKHPEKKCMTLGCHRVPGTAWSADWCQPCNANRMERIRRNHEYATDILFSENH